MIKLYNTLSRKKETFKPIKKGEVGIYSCGPTVYNYAHIGNLRTFITNDIIKRVFLFNNYKVKHVMNITDVDDKTIKGSVKENLSLKDFTRKYETIFLNDLKELNIILPETMPRATETIKEMVDIIKILLKKGYAYKAEDGIYFSVEKFKGYGKLANLKKVKSQKSRIKSDTYDKENIQDFALWKFYNEEDGNVFWETEIGKGRPGWHIECSAMSMKYLNIPFDIHTGAIDLIFPHHTNEIAQSECAYDKKFVNYWVHAGFLTMKEGKMSKSLGNVYTLSNLNEKKFSPLDYRYLTLTSHYRSALLFTWENLENAKNSYERLKNIISNVKQDNKTNKEYLAEFEKAINDDLDMPNALQILWKLVRDEKANGKLQTIKKMDEVFGLKLLEKEKQDIPKEIKELAKKREQARKEKNWKLSDELRNKINKAGYSIEDTSEGMKILKNKIFQSN
jgi:cysteinyl-tRNA synthetase